MRPIDADEVVRKVKKQRAKLFHKEQVNVIKQIILSFVNEAPTLDVQPVVHAEWIEDIYGFCKCSNCGRLEEINYDYCCDCGAKMDKE